jgi:hypothetical protein
MADIMKMGKNPTFLGSWDIEELPNKEIILTIDHITDEEVVTSGQKEICTVCYWEEKDAKKMILNVVNKKALARLYHTKDTEKLKGKAVVIGIDKVKAFGGIHDALRIRHRIPQVQTAAAPKCEQCGNDIAASGSMNHEQVAAYTKTKYGKCLCAGCATAIAQGAQQ